MRISTAFIVAAVVLVAGLLPAVAAEGASEDVAKVPVNGDGATGAKAVPSEDAASGLDGDSADSADSSFSEWDYSGSDYSDAEYQSEL